MNFDAIKGHDLLKLQKFLMAWFALDDAEKVVQAQREALIDAHEDVLPIGPILAALQIVQVHRARVRSVTEPASRRVQAELEHFIEAVLDQREEQMS
jgi:hypothetical protein